jgi:hypothetical protein
VAYDVFGILSGYFKPRDDTDLAVVMQLDHRQSIRITGRLQDDKMTRCKEREFGGSHLFCVSSPTQLINLLVLVFLQALGMEMQSYHDVRRALAD